MNKIMLSAVVMAALSNPTWAVNKCTMPDGKVAFQDAPCTGGKGEALTVRPASGDASTQANLPPAQADWKAKAAQVDARLAIHAAVERREPMIGMSYAQLELAMGLPNRINTGDYKSGSTQQRIYERGQTTWYVYTDEALVTAVQTSMTPSSRKQNSGPCPGGVEIRAAETSASSITLSDAEKVERLKQIREMRNCGK
jgi:hypothetical protein